MTIERRYVVGEGLELRVEGEGANTVVRGLAVPWDSLSLPLWKDYSTGKTVREKFQRGAFADVLAAPGLDVVCLREHDYGKLLGRMAAGTLRVAETERGLDYDFDVPDTQDGKDVVVLAKRGDLRGSSFGFVVRDEAWLETDDSIIRTIVKVRRLDDVSPVTRPAYPASELEARDLESAQAGLAKWRAPAAWQDEFARGMARMIEAGL